tara:strand:- start:293 stop:394 length:102 start_codon:yes stop_codon:yes gene_type:complete
MLEVEAVAQEPLVVIPLVVRLHPIGLVVLVVMA